MVEDCRVDVCEACQEDHPALLRPRTFSTLRNAAVMVFLVDDERWGLLR